jgi:hypothetical protein
MSKEKGLVRLQRPLLKVRGHTDPPNIIYRADFSGIQTLRMPRFDLDHRSVAFFRLVLPTILGLVQLRWHNLLWQFDPNHTVTRNISTFFNR